MDTRDISSTEYQQFGRYLEHQCGIVLGDNKQYLVRSRLLPIVRDFKFDSLSTLLSRVVEGRDRALKSAVIDAMTTNETLWFRDTYPYDLLASSILSELAKSNRPVRIWSAACSSGQEPYSIAMTILEYKKQHPGAFRAGIEIIATDLSTEMLRRAESAEYDTLCLSRGLSEQRKTMFFQKTATSTLQLKPEVRSLVKFRPINLLDSFSSMGRFNVVFCRNVLIYFSADVKRKILQQIAACLQENGILFLGASESISSVSNDFTMVRCSPGLYYTKKT